MKIRIEYDDMAEDIVMKLNTALEQYGLRFEFDDQEHDGFEILSLVKE